MSISAICPVANLSAVNAALESQGFGPGNFSVPAYGATGVTHAALHCWDSSAFLAALQAIPEVTILQDAGDPVPQTNTLIESAGATWGAQSPELPESGTVAAGAIYRYGESGLWYVIQTHDRSVYGGDPAQYPALMRRLRDPYTREPWRQPIDQFDAYKLVNPFTSRPDECTHNGQDWYVTGADGAGNNVWEPGVFGWTVVGQAPAPDATWVDTGATVAQLVGAGVYRVSAIISGLTVGQAVRLGDLPAGETAFNGYWPTAATPSTYITITPHVTASVGAKVWKWA